MAVRRGTISAYVRKKIITGFWKPGRRLPTQAELQQRFKASSQTVQHAMAELAAAGFLAMRGKLGTFVSTHQPHLLQYGLIIPRRNPPHIFAIALQQAAAELSQAGPRRIRLYHHRSDEDMRRLSGDIASAGLAGLIAMDRLPPETMTQLRKSPHIRCAYLASEIVEDAVSVFPDYQSFMRRAVAHLIERGRKRLAILAGITVKPFIDDLRPQWREQGLEIPDCWLHFFEQAIPEAIRNLTHLLMRRPDDRPDGLIIADDNLVEAALTGLLAANVTVPDQVEVVAHCNFPALVPSVMTVTRLGFDAHEILRNALDCLDQRKQGTGGLPLVRIGAVFENEWLSAETRVTG
jgi:DNA-binding LacI/PurR family transcriptional regulator